MGVMKKTALIGPASFLMLSSFAVGASSPLEVASIPSGSAMTAPAHPYNAPFQEGEDLLFRIHWGAVTGGYSSLSIKDIATIEGRPAYHIVSEAHSTGLV